jgi:hypothetical protein
MGLERGLVLSTRGPEGKNLFLTAKLRGNEDVNCVITEMLHVATRHGGSTHPEDWCAWALSQEPSEALVREFEARLGREGVATHPLVLYLIVDPKHPESHRFVQAPGIGEA